MACWPTHSYLCKFPGALLSLFSAPLLPRPPNKPLKLSVFMEGGAKHTGLLDPQRRRGLLPSSDICEGVTFKTSLRRLSVMLPDEEGQENVSEEGTGKTQVQGHQGPRAEGGEGEETSPEGQGCMWLRVGSGGNYSKWPCVGCEGP